MAFKQPYYIWEFDKQNKCILFSITVNMRYAIRVYVRKMEKKCDGIF